MKAARVKRSEETKTMDERECSKGANGEKLMVSPRDIPLTLRPLILAFHVIVWSSRESCFALHCLPLEEPY